MVAIQSDDHVGRCLRKSRLVCPPIPAHLLADHLRSKPLRHIGRTVRRAIVDHNHLVHKSRHPAQHFLNPLFLVQAGNDDGNRQALVQGDRIARPKGGGRRRLAIYNGSVTLRSTLVLAIFTTVAFGQLKQVQSVYILPMGGGLDQYLATRMVEQHLLQVVTDPQRADAVLVDRIGEGLEEKLTELYPDEKKKAEMEKDKKPGSDNNGTQKRVGSTNLQRGKGTIFLIDRRTHTVLWSIYSPSRSTRASDVHKNAEAIVKKLALALRAATAGSGEPPKP